MSKLARVIVALAATGALAGVARAQSAGPNTPGTVVNDAGIGVIPWAAPGDAATSNNAYAAVTVASGTPSQYLKATGFGFAVPAAAVILGIEVDIERRAAIGTIEDNAVRIVKGGTIGATDKSLLPAWPAVDTVATYGSPSDLWGEVWTPANINNVGFGVALSAKDTTAATASVDAFAITVYYGLCGDTIVADNEECDDGNTVSGDCCDATCQFESSGSPCADADLCNGDETCDGAGTCVDGADPVCNDADICSQDSCSPTLGCVYSSTPRLSGCKTALKSVLVYKNNATDTRDKLVWKFVKGQPTTFAQLGVPTGTTAAYTLCLYAGTTSAQLDELTVPGITGWTVIGSNKGYKYKNGSGAEDGVRKIILKSSTANKTKALVKGKGGNLPDITVPIATPVTVQLVSNETSTCFTSQFTTPKKNINGTFKAKSPP